MVSFNKVILVGNLTKDPEVRYAPTGTAVANFRMAVNHRYKQGEELKEEVCYIDIVVFGKQAERCGQYLSKGQSVIVEGRLQERRWETEEGQKRSKHEIVGQNVRFLSRKPGVSPGEKSSALGGSGGEVAEVEEPADNDVPF